MVTKVTTGDGPDFVTTGADNGQGWSIDGTFQCVSDFAATTRTTAPGDYLDNSVVKAITLQHRRRGREVRRSDGLRADLQCGKPTPTCGKAAGLTDKDIPDHLLGPAPGVGRREASPSPTVRSTASRWPTPAGPPT
ncbi:MAG: hypothetical protein ACLRL4_00030 [Bifidobacterium bifidum]